jgi:uncharacterized membrane-anchored protein YhcB (DUF1043 family)
MEFEEFQRSMEFVVVQQAQFAADMQRSREAFDRSLAESRTEFDRSRAEWDRRFAESRELGDKRYAEFTRALSGLVALVGASTTADKRADERIRALEESNEEFRRWQEEYQRWSVDVQQMIDGLTRDVERLQRKGDIQ